MCWILSVLEVLSIQHDKEDLDYTTQAVQSFGWMFLYSIDVFKSEPP